MANEYFYYKLVPRSGRVTPCEAMAVLATIGLLGYGILRDGFNETVVAVETDKKLSSKAAGTFSADFLVTRYDGSDLRFV